MTPGEKFSKEVNDIGDAISRVSDSEDLRWVLVAASQSQGDLKCVLSSPNLSEEQTQQLLEKAGSMMIGYV